MPLQTARTSLWGRPRSSFPWLFHTLRWPLQGFDGLVQGGVCSDLLSCTSQRAQDHSYGRLNWSAPWSLVGSWSPKGGACNSAAASEAEIYSKGGEGPQPHVADTLFRTWMESSIRSRVCREDGEQFSQQALWQPASPAEGRGQGDGTLEGAVAGKVHQVFPGPELFGSCLLKRDLHGEFPLWLSRLRT